MIFIVNWLFSWLLTSFLNGLFFFLLFVFLYYWFYLKDQPIVRQEARPQFEQFSISSVNENLFSNQFVFSLILKFQIKIQAVRDMMFADANRDPNDPQSSNKDSVFALNMMFQFLFQELKDTKAVRRYIIRKMSMEFKELLNSKAAGKIIQKISVKKTFYI
jgi:hypothetical protein